MKAVKASDLLDSSFLSNMVAVSKVNQKSSKFSFVYSDFMKDVALHIFCMAGRAAYETLHRNLPGVIPRLRSTQYRLAQQARPNEGEFLFEQIKAKMIENGEVLQVIVADDDTKLQEALRYDSRTNTVLGLKLPLGPQGTPIRSSFEFTCFAAVRAFVESNPQSTYVKLMTVQSISPGSRVYQLVMYGTRGSDKSDDTFARWNYVWESFATIGVIVKCKLPDFR